MKKYKVWIAIVLSIVVVVVIFNIGAKIYSDRVSNELTTYLEQKKGYNNTDIAQIQTTISKAPVVSSAVIFKDEPNAMYFYKPANGGFEQYKKAPAIYGADQKYLYKHSETPN